MFSRIVFFALSALPLLAAAAPAPQFNGPQCNVAPTHCCDTVQPSDAETTSVEDLIPIILNGVAVPVGLTCTPINVLGAGNGGSCSAQPACCEDVEAGLACSPFNINA